MPSLAPIPLTSPSTGSSSSPTTLLHLKLNLAPPKDASGGCLAFPEGSPSIPQTSLQYPSIIPRASYRPAASSPCEDGSTPAFPRPPHTAHPLAWTPQHGARRGCRAQRGEKKRRRGRRGGGEVVTYRPALLRGSFRCRRRRRPAASARALNAI